tara:strand:+ start:361 stop:570 length:210 start_codon:yes stop_codon:yes gene_type:complete
MGDCSSIHYELCIFCFKLVRRAAYTFDAGPNGVVYILEKDFDAFLQAVLYCFPGPGTRQMRVHLIYDFI